MNSALGRAVLVAIGIATLLGWLHVLGVGLLLLWAVGVVVAAVTICVPWIGVRRFDDIVHALRRLYWSSDQGGFHSFAGVPLHIENDGRHVWVAGQDLMRVLGRPEPEEALAARHTGRWRRDDQARLMLRVDAVVQYLNTMPSRDQPRVLRLRRYFEREVLFPADRRRETG